MLFTRFSKTGYSKKIVKDNVVQFMLSFHKTFINLEKLTYIVLSTIFYQFPSKANVLFLFQTSFEKTWIRDNTGWPNTVLLETYVVLKIHMVCCCIWIHIVLSRILYIVFPRIYYKFLPKTHIIFCVQKFTKTNCIRVNMVQPILFFQGSYRNFNQRSYFFFFWCSNIY